jgi:uroporphyrinogen-III synthase
MNRVLLRNTTVWITRPVGVASELAARLENLGATVIAAPALQILPLPAGHSALHTAAVLLQNLHQYQHIIFISGNAVQHGLALLRQYCPQWPPQLRCYAIGKTTARLLADQGIEALQPEGSQMDSEALLRRPELQKLAGEKVLIVRGIGGREWLAQAIIARGAQVDYLEAYQRTKSGTLGEKVVQQIASGDIDFILAASGETLASVVALVGSTRRQALMKTAVVVPGTRVEALARQLGFKQVIIAANAGDDAMVEAVIGATQQQG